MSSSWFPPRRRNSLLKFILLVPVIWFCIAIINSSSSRSKDDPGGDSGDKGVAPGVGHGADEKPVVNGDKTGNERHVRSNDGLDKHGNAANGANIPKPIQFVPDPDNPIYQYNPNMPGEKGVAVKVDKEKLKAVDRKVYDDGWQANAFNQFASDQISVHRSPPDAQDKECLDENYDTAHFPSTSVIVCFHNEAWSVLLRSVHSILERTPPEMLKEIILVDDFSDKPHLKDPLVRYMTQFPKVKIVRMPKREGLIRARLRGASSASGKVLTFLDSHIECANGWLPPLLDRIHKDPHNVVCPVIDVIDDDTFQFHFSKAMFSSVGGFDWSLQFNWHPVPEREKKLHKKPIEPLASPTMAGGLFSIDKAYFEYLGSYDPGFDIWGGENLEISFKIWMCGGRLEIVPCSHVGHIFRKRSPYKWRSGVNVLKRNSIRLAEVWLDEYKKYYYERINNQLGDFGNVSERRALRERIGCKSFKWYLDNIFPELFVPGDAIATGEVRNQGLSGRMCLDSPIGKEHNEKAVSLYPCHNQGGNQYWLLSKDGEIRRDESCVDYAGKDVMIFPCHGMKGNQHWKYDHNAHQLLHVITNKCLEMNQDGSKLLMNPCNVNNNAFQQWVFKTYDAKKAQSYGIVAGR